MQSLLTRFFVFGAIFGLMFPVIALSLDTYLQGYALDGLLLLHLHQKNPIHWIIDLAPIILSLTAYYVGKIVLKREALGRARLETEVDRIKAVAQFTQDLALGNVPVMPRLVEDDPELKKSLTKIKQDIQAIRKEQENKRWLESHLYRLTELLEKGKREDLPNLMNELLGKVIRLLGAVAGRIFVVEKPAGQKEYLRVLSSWGGITSEAVQERIYPGENAVGQCYHSQKPIGLPMKWENTGHQAEFTGKYSTAYAYICPLMLDDAAFKMGVWELDFLKEPPAHHKELILKISLRIAFNLWLDREAQLALAQAA